MKYKVAISGSYGGMNLGDETILKGILKEIRINQDIDVVVFSVNPKDTEERHNVRAIPIREMHKDEVVDELKKLDLFILGGGGILFDGLVNNFLRDVLWAKELGIPVMVYAISVGPLKLPESKQLVVETLNKVDLITVRESEAKRILNDLGVTQPIEVTADPAFLLEPEEFTSEMLKNEGIQDSAITVGFSVREPGPAAPDLTVEHYHAILANAADFMVDRFDARIIFVPMELGANRDPQHSHAIIAKMTNVQCASVLKGNYNSAQILGLMKHMSFAVGMRLHFLIFAGLQGVPFIPLPYASKVKGLLQDLELPMSPLEDLNPGRLCAYLDRAWDTRTMLKSKLQEKIPYLKEKSRRTHQLLGQLLETLAPKAG